MSRKSRTVFITGTSSGLGKSLALALTQAGYTVFGTSRQEQSAWPGFHPLKMDVRNLQSIKNCIQTVTQMGGSIDILINNAGMGIAGPLESCSLEETELQMDTNFLGFAMVCQEIIPMMREKKSGIILQISSIGGLMGLPFQGMYSASKFAIEGYSEALRMELKPFNIKVILINPGDFRTGFTNARKITGNSESLVHYNPRFSHALHKLETDEKNGLPPHYLARKVLRILEKRNPSTRYIIASPEQKLAVLLKRILPGSLFDRILMSHYEI